MKKFGLIGHPISHSFSPKLFNAAYGGKYTYDLIEGSEFENSWKRFLEEYDGINVTAPFKELALKKADLLSAECEAIGAANILVKTSEGIKAYNSDYSAVALLLLEEMKKKPASTALIVGCGGAGKAAIVASLEVGLKTSIVNRSIEKAQAFADSLGEIFGKKRKVSVYGLDEIPDADIIIYTLPMAIPGIEKFEGKTVIEANYKDPVINSESGKKWLLSQAVNGYSIFTGETPDAEAMAKVYEG